LAARGYIKLGDPMSNLGFVSMPFPLFANMFVKKCFQEFVS